MKRTLMAVVCLFGLAMASSASAALINVNGQLVPDSIAGVKVNGEYQKYRLIFVTAGATAATDTTKASYDNFVKAEANRDGSIFKRNDNLYDWKAVVSVGAGSVSPSDTALAALTGNGLGSRVIYNPVGASIGTGAGITAAPGLAAPVGYHQFLGDAGGAAVWTGSEQNGDAATDSYQGGPLWLGTPVIATFGIANSVTGAWLNADQIVDGGRDSDFVLPKFLGSFALGLPVYAISGELTAIPEPSTIALWSVCAGVVGLATWRKRRKSS